jgi:hypothetical protein
MKRIRMLTVAALALPMALAAQQPAAPPPANPMTMAYKQFSNRYSTWLVAAFDSIPASKYGYKPTPSQLTVGYIAQHLENANYSLCAHFGDMTMPASAKDSLADTVKAQWPKDTLVARLKASFTFCDNALDKLSDTKLADPIAIGPQAPGRTIIRTRYMLGYVTDLADHWSQIANYMRLNGMIPASAQPRPTR